MTSVNTPRRQLSERDLAMAPVLSAKSLGRVNASIFGRRPRRPGYLQRVHAIRRAAISNRSIPSDAASGSQADENPILARKGRRGANQDAGGLRVMRRGSRPGALEDVEP